MTTLRYDIRVDGHLDRSHWPRWFEGMEVTLVPDGNTAIWGPVADQSALHRLLVKIRDLGLPLIALQRVEIEPESTNQNNCSGETSNGGAHPLVTSNQCLRNS